MRITSLISALTLALWPSRMLLAGDEAFFSSLPQAQQEKLRAMVVAPPPQQRYGPYSTPMYYLMRKGYSYNGAWDRNPDQRPHPQMAGQPLSPDYGSWALERARPDWQEEMIRDWV